MPGTDLIQAFLDLIPGPAVFSPSVERALAPGIPV